MSGSRASEDKETSSCEEHTTLPARGSTSKRERIRKKILAGVLVALTVGLIFGFFVGSLPLVEYEKQIVDLQNQLLAKQQDYNVLNTNFLTLMNEHEDLENDYRNLTEEYEGALKVPYTTIKQGNVTWVFTVLDGTIEEWHMPLDTYSYYVERSKPSEYHSLTTDGMTFTVRNMELFVQPDFFSGVIDTLADGNTGREFVQEVFNLRKQLTTYSSDITDTPQWSAETMTEGTGDCEDFAILMASLLTSGNQYAHYGMTVQMVYMDANNPTNPAGVNHVMLCVEYQDGAKQLLDSTSISVLCPWSTVTGWYFDL